MSEVVNAYGKVINPGDTVVDSRGKGWTYKGLSNTNKILVVDDTDQMREFFPTVFGLRLQ